MPTIRFFKTNITKKITNILTTPKCLSSSTLSQSFLQWRPSATPYLFFVALFFRNTVFAFEAQHYANYSYFFHLNLRPFPPPSQSAVSV